MFTQFAIKNWLMDEQNSDSGAGGGGAEGELNIDIDKVSDQLGADLGLGDDHSATPSGDKEKEDSAPTDDAAAKAREAAARAGELGAAKKLLGEKKVDFAGKKDEEILALAKEHGPQVRGLPKAWKKEMEGHWGKLSPEVQAYVEEREAQALAGITQYKADSDYAKSMRDILGPYQPLLDAQGVKDHAAAVRFLMVAHNNLSTGDGERRAAYLAHLAKSYQIDKALFDKHLSAEPAYQTETEKQLAARLNKVEGQLTEKETRELTAAKARISQEIDTFAADPAHPYFNEVADHIALLLADPRKDLKTAYEEAVWANPVTRAKEQARLQKEADAARQKEAEAAAEKAKRARGTVVRGEGERKSSEPLGSWDDTMREKYKELQG